MDDAVTTLVRKSQQGQLPGSFYGRLHTLAAVPAAQDSMAVNAVLRDLCNLVILMQAMYPMQASTADCSGCRTAA